MSSATPHCCCWTFRPMQIFGNILVFSACSHISSCPHFCALHKLQSAGTSQTLGKQYEISHFLLEVWKIPSLSLQLFQLTAAAQQPPGPGQIYDFLQFFPLQCFPLSVCVRIPFMMQKEGANGWGNICSFPWLSKQLWDCLFHCCLMFLSCLRVSAHDALLCLINF